MTLEPYITPLHTHVMKLLLAILFGMLSIQIASADKGTFVDEIQFIQYLDENTALAEEMISKALTDAGAKKIDGKWTFDNKEIELIAFIRSDDPVRKSIGEILSSELEKIGFKVIKDFGDLNKAFVNVYGSNPSDIKWSFYTEGWGGRSA